MGCAGTLSTSTWAECRRMSTRRPGLQPQPSCKENSRERPLRKARLRERGPFSGGVAPAPPAVRLCGLGRPARIANRLADSALPYLLLVRANRKSCLDTTPQAVRLAIFPARAGLPSCADGTTARARLTANKMLAWTVRGLRP